MSAQWETQKVIYSTLISNSSLMTLINNNIDDTPPTNLNYPYVVIGDMQEIDSNRLNFVGYEISATINIYVKDDGLGFFKAKKILEEINKSLNAKRLPMSNYEMIICKFDNAITDRENDVKIVSARYVILCDDNTNKIN